MNLQQYITEGRDNLSPAVLNILVDIQGDEYLDKIGSLKDAPVVVKIGEIEIPIDAIGSELHRQMSDMFDSAVAEAAKDLVFRLKLDAATDRLRSALDGLSDMAYELNSTVGRALADELGPGANWSESTGSC